jgi:hypothetical protein
MDDAMREELLVSLERIGESSPRARSLAAVHRGLSTPSERLDAERWGDELARASEASVPAARAADRAAEAEAAPGDVAAQLALARELLALALEREDDERFRRVLLDDVARILDGLPPGSGDEGLRALLQLVRGNPGEATLLALRAVEEGDEPLPLEVLALYTRARRGAIWRAARAGEPWPAEWMADLDAAHGLLVEGGLATEEELVAHHDFLRAMGASARAQEVLAAGLERHPLSAPLHARLRAQLLAERSLRALDGLEATYAALVAGDDSSPALLGYAGYASLVAAEFHRRAGRGAEAVLSYERGIAHYGRVRELEPGLAAEADHYVALALAGQARVALERGDLYGALVLIAESFARDPRAAGSLDGLGISPVGTARMLRARLEAAGREELVAVVDAELTRLAELDPVLLELPAFERGGRPSR